MTGDWLNTQLSKIAEKSERAFAMGPFGSNIKAENYRESGVPVLRGTNLGGPGEAPFKASNFVFLTEEKADELASSNAHPNDIVFVAQGTVGKVGIIPSYISYPRFVLSQNLMKVTVDSQKADPRLVFYFFRSAQGQHEIMSRVNPTGVPCISKPLTSLRQFGVLIPSDIKEQRAIAHILGTLDDKIEVNLRMNETLEGIAKAIFKSWFVDFDPVRAKLEGRWRPDQSLPGLPVHLYDLFPTRLVPSELGQIPEGWRISRLGDVADVKWGDTNTTKKSYSDTGFVAYSAKGPDGFLPYHDFDRVGVVVSAIGANSGYTWLARGKWSCIKNTIRFWATDSNISTEYLFLATHGNNIWPLRGSAQPFISQTDARNLQVFHPAKGIAKSFGKIVEPLFAKIEANNQESRILAALRDTLLSKLISGKLQVKDAERIVGRYT